MFRQIIVAMAGAIAAQLTAATLDFTPADRHEHIEPQQSAIRLAIVPAAPRDFFVVPASVAAVVPFPGSPQRAD